MQSFSSSQDFVKALKVPSDPPVNNGSTKIEIARQAWDQDSFYAPRKGEVIADWILSRLLKDKTQDRGSNPILDYRYWKLLVDVLGSPERSVTTNSWLTPLLLRTPFVPIVIAFLDLIPNADLNTREQITPLVRSCFTKIWPIYAPKATVEVFLDCFGASLRAWKNQSLNEDVAKICIEVALSFRRSLSTANAKKKVYAAFTQHIFADWIAVLSHPTSTHSPDVLDALYGSGVECLFNLDVLRDSKSESMLFDALDKVNSTTILPVIPRLYQSYIQVIKRHRGALFGQGSSHSSDNMEELREAGMRFFASCQSLIGKADSKSEAWRTTASLLDSIDQENIFSIQSESESMIKGSVQSILTELISNREDIINPVLECLTCIARVDHRLIEPVLPDVFSRLLLIPDSVSSAFQLLNLVLQYHGKTRLVHTYIETIMLSARTFATSVADPRHAYGTLSHSALLHPLHLDQLAKYTHSFLPLSQTSVAVQSTIGAIENHWKEYSALQGSESNGNPRKRRKTDTGSGSSTTVESMALGFLATANLAAVILSSFSTDSVPEALENELESMLTEFRSYAFTALSKMLKVVLRNADVDCWASQIVLLAMLRVVYAIRLRQHGPTQGFDAKLASRMSECLQCELLPEVKLEILRNLLKDVVLENRESDILDQALVLVQPNSAPHVMHMIIQRWLPFVDQRASENQLKTMIDIFMKIQTQDLLRVGNTQALPAMLIAQAFSSAEFWELPNLRGALLAYVDNATNMLDDESSTLNLNATEVKDILAIYNVLLLVPGEYLIRPLKISLFRRAFALDMLLCSNGSLDVSDLHHTLSVLRVFASRIFPTLDYDYSEQSINAIYTYLRYLLALPTKVLSPQVVSDTLDLAAVLLTGLLKRSESSNHKETLSLIKSYLEVLNPSSFTDMEISAQLFNRTVELLSGEYKLQSFPSQCHIAFTKLLRALQERLFPPVYATMTSASTAIDVKNILDGWRHVLIFSRWLGLDGKEKESAPHAIFLADKKTVPGDHAAKIFAFPPSKQSAAWNETCVVVFGIFLEEIHLCEDGELKGHLANMVAVYIIFSRACTDERLGAVDEHLSAACSRLSADHFNFILELVADSLNDPDDSSGLLRSLVHLATLLLRNPPPNTLQMTQNFTARCINTFNGHPVFVRDARSSVLEFLTLRCRDRPAALRLQNVSGIWSFLAKISAPSEVHDLHTSVEDFHAILSITTALVRLRRDLVILTIPHLAMILRYLIFSMQSARPNLGSQQTALISRGLPSWMNLSEPLSAEEAKALSRLLESLTTKTLVKTHSSASNTAQKAESLAKPFSKHAAYVLNAYVEALNNPLCIIPVAVKKELQPGLYALCGMLTDYSRDALMASSTDAGEKASLKSLWKAYEKQRYVGKG